MRSIIEVVNLVKRFKDVVAVDGVSFSVREGEIYGLLGPNGAGKTTTISIIITLLKPTSGTVYVDGIDVTKKPNDVRKKLGVVFQDPSLDVFLTAYENLYIHGKIYGLGGLDLENRIREALKFVELEEFSNKVVRYFSGGMRRRLEIARALIHDPEILVLDEPTIGLDPQTRNKVWDYVRTARKEKGVTILMTTHYMDEAEQLCDRISIMDHGKILVEGTADQLKSYVGADVILITLGDSSEPACIQDIEDLAIKCKIIDSRRIEIVTRDAVRTLPRIFEEYERRGVKISEISYRRPTLNEVFLHFTGRELRDSLENDSKPIRRWR
ncbi:MAG: ATP-binding cassette domain-containing protein [Sulfolobales archaeon]